MKCKMMQRIKEQKTIYLAAVFRKVDTSSEHSTDIRVSFIKAFLDNCLKENVFHRK